MAEGLATRTKLSNGTKLRLLGDEDESLRAWSNEDLMLAHGRGCDDSFEELLRRHQRGVMNFIYRMLQNRSLAEELTQEVFMALVRSRKRYRPTAKFTTYLYKIASNLVSKEWQRRKRRPAFFSLSSWGRSNDEEDAYGPMDVLSDDSAWVMAKFELGEISEAVNHALREIPDHQREAFVLHRLQEMPYDEVARVTGSPVGTVKSRVVRAERALRPLLTHFREYVRK